MNRIIFITAFLAMTANILFANEFKGRVLNGTTKEPIIGATINVEKINLGAITNNQGEFSIIKINNGKYLLKISMIGFETKILKLEFPLITEQKFDIELKEIVILTKDIVVTAGKKIQTVQEVPISMSVIDLKTIQQRNNTDIDKILDYVPGVKTNGAQVSIRGSSGFALGFGSRVAFLIDGFPVLSGDQGDMKFDLIPTFVIQKLEIVKGAGSALYGSSALGGVINAITEDPESNGKIKFKAYSGLFTQPKYNSWYYSDEISKFYGVDGSFSKKFDNTSLVISSRYMQDDSYRKFDERQNFSIFSKVKHEFNSSNLIQLNTSYSLNYHDDWVYWKSLDSATVPPDNTDLKVLLTSEKMTVFVLYKYLFDNNNFIEFRSGLLRTDFRNNADKNTDNYRASAANSFNYEIQLNNSILNNLFLTSGINYVYNMVESNIYGTHHQQTFAFYSQFEWKPFLNLIEESSNFDLKNMIITTGIRGDFEKTQESNLNQEYSPKLGCVLKLADKTNIRASLGKGFRTVTIAEKFTNLSYGPFKIKPNFQVAPETNITYEMGANQELSLFNSIFSIDLSAFANHLNNMIEASFIEEDNEFFIQFGNIQKARIFGLELELKTLLFSTIGLQTSVTYMDAYDLTLKEPLKYRSEILWYSNLLIPLGDFEIHSDYRFISRPETVDDLLEKFISDASARVNAHIVDLRVSYNFKNLIEKDIKINLIANNLLDYYYTIYPGNLAPTRSLVVQLSGSF